MFEDRCVGAMLGLALGDAYGAPFEGGILERSLWALIGKTLSRHRRFTDDTQMALDVAQCLINSRPINQTELARMLANNYRWSRGYGPGAARTLGLIRRGKDWRIANRSQYQEGSLGNGAAIRVLPVALTYTRLATVRSEALNSADVTHCHPEAKECAWLIACAASGLLAGQSLRDSLVAASLSCECDAIAKRIHILIELFDSPELTPQQIVSRFGSSVIARESVFCALYLANFTLDKSFDTLLACARKCGGDVDSVSAMAGALWGAANGAAKLPPQLLANLEGKVTIELMAKALCGLHS
jgi:poly(ADP-ribose) glycohydrolase ARH3